jgi:biopolymer transport protein ExbB
MKKLLTLLAVVGIMNLGFISATHAQNDASDNTTEMAEAEEVDDDMTEDQDEAEEAAEAEMDAAIEQAEVAAQTESDDEEAPKDRSFTQVLKTKFIEGGPEFMGIVLVCLILGLAIVIERVIYLNMSTTNTDKLLNNIEESLKSGGVDAAKEVCRNTAGPVASIFYQGLDRSHEGVEMVEKSVISYGSVQMGLLEKGVSWISLFIALAPMLGFMGTVIGMIDAFDAIAEANNISPAIVANGIKVALLTTVFGLIVAIILQIFYNYIVAKIDSLVNDMENASISLVDLLVKHELSKK